jgi:prephenate dehydrogenase
MWAEILLENRGEVSCSIRDTITKLDEFLVALDGANQEELRSLLTEAKTLRDTLP